MLKELPKEIFENGLYYELKDDYYYVPCLLPPEPDGENEQLALIIRQMAEAQGVDEVLKEHDQMAWVGAMNNIRQAAREIMREAL